jgi:hypothetical protein
MAATVSAAAAGLKTALVTIKGLRVYDFLPDAVSVPMATVMIEQVNYHGAFQGGDPIYRFNVMVLVARTSERTAQSKLDAYVSYGGDESVRAAIEADKTLGGVVQTLIIDSTSNIQVVQINEATYLGIDFSVAVHA